MINIINTDIYILYNDIVNFLIEHINQIFMNTIKKLKLKSVPPFKYDIYLILDIYYFCSLIHLNFP